MKVRLINAILALASLFVIFSAFELLNVSAPIWLQVFLSVTAAGAWLRFGEKPLLSFFRKGGGEIGIGDRESEPKRLRPKFSEILLHLDLGGWGMTGLAVLFLLAVPSMIEQDAFGMILFALSPLIFVFLYWSNAYHEAKNELLSSEVSSTKAQEFDGEAPRETPAIETDSPERAVKVSPMADGRTRVEIERADGSIESFKALTSKPRLPLPVPAGKELLKERITNDGRLERVFKDVESGAITRIRCERPKDYIP